MGEDLGTTGERARRGGARFAAGLVTVVVVMVGGGGLLHAQQPSVIVLDAATASVPPAAILDGQAGLVAGRLSQASGRTLESLASAAPDRAVNPLESDAPVVAGAQAASSEYAETLAKLSEAEMAAAEQLATSEQEAAQAENERLQAADALDDAEAEAARAVDAAIAAAIAAAQAQSAYTPDYGGTGGGATGGGAIPSGRATSTAEVLSLVRRSFPDSEVGNAMAVSRCESGHRNVVGAANGNGTRDYGVFQINDGGTLQAALTRIGIAYSSVTDARSKALDPELNVRMARVIWQSRGWQPWVCAAKVKVVAGLYQRAPGPMYGKYDEYGRAL